MKVDLGQDGARTLHLLRRRDHLGGAGDDDLALLVRAAAIEGDAVPLRVLAFAVTVTVMRVAEGDGPPEAAASARGRCAGAGELGPQEGGDERRRPTSRGR